MLCLLNNLLKALFICLYKNILDTIAIRTNEIAYLMNGSELKIENEFDFEEFIFYLKNLKKIDLKKFKVFFILQIQKFSLLCKRRLNSL